MAGGSSALKLIKKYSIVVLFPTFTVSTIYADWSHTRQWKQSQKIQSIKQTTDISL